MKKVVPCRTFTTSVFDKGQQSFVRNLFDFKQESVVPIISHYHSLDDAIPMLRLLLNMISPLHFRTVFVFVYGYTFVILKEFA